MDLWRLDTFLSYTKNTPSFISPIFENPKMGEKHLLAQRTKSGKI